jgi:hypothetical protein
MELESALLWFSRISLIFWIGVLIWCGVSIARKHKKEKEWLSQYMPTLQGNLRETEIKSWVTLDELERLREEAPSERRARKRAQERTGADG